MRCDGMNFIRMRGIHIENGENSIKMGESCIEMLQTCNGMLEKCRKMRRDQAMTAEELLRRYQKVYGEIVFPDDDIDVLREVWRNPAGWMYSFDGIQWEAAPMDIAKLDYTHALFRKDTFQKREWRDSK